MKKRDSHYLFSILRILIGLIFLWAFFDKLIGLGFSTCLDSNTNSIQILCEKAWVKGGSPTAGFLSNSPKGPFKLMFNSISSSIVVEWLFMLGLLFIGLTLSLGFATRLGSLSGMVMLILMYLAVIPPKTNPLIDDHIIYATILLSFFLRLINIEKLSLSKYWNNLNFVKKHEILQ